MIHKLFLTLILLIAFGNTTAQPATGNSALDWAKKKCIDIGFKAGTERFGNCVLQLSRNDEAVNALPKQAASSVGARPQTQTTSMLKSFKDCDECPEMVVIPSGKFLMGSKDDPFINPSPSKDEMPQHEVFVKSFALAKFEVTQEQWYSIMGTLPSKFKGRTLPVDGVSWDDAQEFIKKLNQKTGKRYRLPSEAEWEYAARAGSTTEFSFGDDVSQSHDYSWSFKNSNSQTHPVGEKFSNKFGLHDMHGNVWEWCQDCWNVNYVGAPNDGSPWLVEGCTFRVLRGGAWGRFESTLKSAYRYSAAAAIKGEEFGFRVARDN